MIALGRKEPNVAGKEIVVHFGVHKTGTTSIQHALFGAREALATEGILYPDILGKPNHFDLYTYFHKRPLENRMVQARGITNVGEAEQLKADIRKSFEDQISASRSERVILSSEALSRMNQHEMHQFMAYLASLGFERVKAVVYLRDYLTYWESNLQQTIKGGKYIDLAVEEQALTHIRKYRPLLEALGACASSAPGGECRGHARERRRRAEGNGRSAILCRPRGGAAHP